MAAGTTFKMTGWKKLKTIFSPADFGAVLVPNLKRATAFNAQLVRKEIRQRIVDMKYSPNSLATIAMKGSSKPLVGKNSQLFNGVTTLVVNEKTAFVGLLRQTRIGKNQAGLANLAEMLHKGMTITVTPAMRHMFLLLYEVSEGREHPEILKGRAKELWETTKGNFLPIGKNTTHIIIPGRHFISEVFEDHAVLEKCKANWAKAVEASIMKVTKGG